MTDTTQTLIERIIELKREVDYLKLKEEEMEDMLKTKDYHIQQLEDTVKDQEEALRDATFDSHSGARASRMYWLSKRS